MFEFDNDNLRALSGLILLLLSVVYLLLRAENANIEYVLIALAGFLVGGSFFNKINK